MILKSLIIVFAITTTVTVASAQDSPVTINKSQIPPQASDVNKFVPRGWKIEEQLTGDLNGDSQADYVLKLVEDKAAKDAEGDPTERSRALVVALAGSGGTFMRAAVADRLLQCTRCGGAFYGVVESPAEVKIEKGIIVVEQDHGSRNLTNTTYRFRYDADSKRFILIGFDYADSDRLTAKVVSESTNYLTGVRKTTRDRGKREVTTTTQIPRTKIFLDQVNYEKFEEEADRRLV